MYTSERSLTHEGKGEITPSSLKADLSSGKVHQITDFIAVPLGAL